MDRMNRNGTEEMNDLRSREIEVDIVVGAHTGFNQGPLEDGHLYFAKVY